jgi:TolB-like protein/cytochrome c-type biogenesis protein CcmH/NrfG
MSLFNELKKRNVFRVGLAYLVSSWVIAQVAGLVLDSIKAPDWVMQALLLMLGLGFIVALIIAWAYELTPEGIKKEKDVVRDDSVVNITSKKLNTITLFAAIAVLVMFVYQQFGDKDMDSRLRGNDNSQSVIPAKARTSSNATELDSRLRGNDGVVDKSIAVLPFIPLSANENDAYFGKGLAEELLNALAKFPELKVAARTSAFSLGGKDVDLREVGAKLGVAHVLEGSVRSVGDKVRVTAQLIRASDGFHLWSQTYDRNMADIFQVQDEIVTEINRTLQIRLGVGVGEGRATAKQVDPVAYQNYLHGLELWGLRAELKSRRGAIRSFQLATSQDPNFADGWAGYGVSLVHSLSNLSGMNKEQHRSATRNALEAALMLDDENVRALAGLGAYYIVQELDVGRATASLRRALELSPNSAESRYDWTLIPVFTGNLSDIRQVFDQALSLDPLNQTIKRVYAEALGVLGDYDSVSEYVENCDDCTRLDQILGLSALYMAARRNGTDNQVRKAAAKYNAQLNKNGSLLKPYYSKTYVTRQLTISSPAVVESLLSGLALPEQELKILRSLPKEDASFNEPLLLAQIGETNAALSMLELAYNDTLSDLFLITQPMGRDVWPEAMRRDPRFHAFWQKPGMPELAAMLREKGKTAGLPLPLP